MIKRKKKYIGFEIYFCNKEIVDIYIVGMRIKLDIIFLGWKFSCEKCFFYVKWKLRFLLLMMESWGRGKFV